MSRSRTMLTNAAIVGGKEVILTLLTVFVVSFMARKLGTEDYGVYSLAFAFPELFAMLGSMGLRPLMIREVSRNRESYGPYLRKLLPLRFFLILAMSALSMVAAVVFGYESKILLAVAIAVVFYFFEHHSRIVTDLFQAVEEVWRVSFRDVFIKIVTGVVTIVVLLPFAGGGLYSVCLVYLLGGLLGFCINAGMFRKRFSVEGGFEFDRDFALRQLKMGVPYILIGFATIVMVRIDVVMLSKLKGMAAVGEYNAALNIFRRLFMLPEVIATVSFPAIAGQFLKNPSEAGKLCARSSVIIAGVILPIAVGGVLLAEPIISLLFGEQYSNSAVVFKIMLVNLPMISYATFFSYVLGAINKEHYASRTMIFMAALNVILNFALIPSLGPAGSALASLSSYAAGTVVLGVPVFRHLRLWDKAIDLAAVLLGLGAMTALVLAMKDFNLILRIVSGGLAYLVCVLAVEGKRIKQFAALRNQTSRF